MKTFQQFTDEAYTHFGFYSVDDGDCENVNEAGDYWHPDPEKDRRLSGAGPKLRAREDRDDGKKDPTKLRRGETYKQYSKRRSTPSTRVTVIKSNKPNERKRDKIIRKIGSVIDRVAGIKS